MSGGTSAAQSLMERAAEGGRSALESGRSALSSGIAGVRKQLGGAAPPDEEAGLLRGLQSSLEEATTLTLQQRLAGFGGCALMGVACSAIAAMSLLRPVKFALAFSVANLFFIGASFFVAGAARQVANLRKNGRLPVFLGYVGAMALTLLVALRTRSVLLTVPCLLTQLVLLLYYALSYVPFGQRLLTKLFSRYCDCLDFSDG